MTLGIMQPYVFPYIGYFQLVNAVDTFIFYDDVNFIKGGWINRNRILTNKQAHTFTIPLKNQSSFAAINQTQIDDSKYEAFILKFLKTITQNYSRASNFEQVYPLLNNIFLDHKYKSISEIAARSVIVISNYLNIKTNFKIASREFEMTKIYNRQDRIINICKMEKANRYVNLSGGQTLYDKTLFNICGIDLEFIRSRLIKYEQSTSDFVPNLSIIDVLMHNSKKDISNMLSQYELI